MAFVNEKVSEEDKLSSFFQRTSPFPPYGQKLHPYWWTIDRERGFIFDAVALSDREIPDRFVYQWRGELGAVMARKSFVQFEDQKRQGLCTEYTWTIEALHIPTAFDGCQNEIKDILSEAFCVYVFDYGRYYGKGHMPSAKVVWDRCSVVIGGNYYVKL